MNRKAEERKRRAWARDELSIRLTGVPDWYVRALQAQCMVQRDDLVAQMDAARARYLRAVETMERLGYELRRRAHERRRKPAARSKR